MRSNSDSDEFAKGLGVGLQFFLQRYQPFRDGELGKPGDGVNVEFAHNPLAVGFYRPHSDTKPAGDFFVAQTLGDGDQDFAFPSADLARMRTFALAANVLI